MERKSTTRQGGGGLSSDLSLEICHGDDVRAPRVSVGASCPRAASAIAAVIQHGYVPKLKRNRRFPFPVAGPGAQPRQVPE